MNTPVVLITDIVWDDIELEAKLFAEAGYRAVLATDTSEQGLARAAAEFDVVGIQTCFAPVTAAVIDAAPNLRGLSRTGVGVDNIDTVRAADRGIPVERVVEYCSNEVAVHAVALALACWRRLREYQSAMLAGRWGTGAQDAPVRRAEGARAAVLGLGRIGGRVQTALEALGFAIQNEVDGADLVSIHLPLTDETRGSVNAGFFARLAPGAVVVNTARGGVMNLDDALSALQSGQLSALGLDVFPTEPLPADTPLLTHPHVVLTPHVGFYSRESLIELREKATANLIQLLGGA